MAKPITPSEATKAKQATLPDAVIEAFNELIAANWNGRSATIRQKDAVALIANKLDCKTDEVFAKHYLDVEPIFEKAGWKVEYDKPGFNESYEATFKFTKKRAKQ